MFGERLKKLRIDNDYSMAELINIYNLKYNGKMNKSTLSRYENNLQEPIYTVVVNLAKLFGVSVDYLAADCNADNIDEYYDLYNQLDDIDKAEIRGEIKQMLKADKYN